MGEKKPNYGTWGWSLILIAAIIIIFPFISGAVLFNSRSLSDLFSILFFGAPLLAIAGAIMLWKQQKAKPSKFIHWFGIIISIAVLVAFGFFILFAISFARSF